jgi:hypothetical protein
MSGPPRSSVFPWDRLIYYVSSTICSEEGSSASNTDNGTNFVGAYRELKSCIEDWNQSRVANEPSQKGTEWVFNPPASPHMGGAWERLVRSCKRNFKAVLQKQVLTDEVLATAMAEVESLVNSRPLTEVSSDVDATEAITPNHFLLGPPNYLLVYFSSRKH